MKSWLTALVENKISTTWKQKLERLRQKYLIAKQQLIYILIFVVDSYLLPFECCQYWVYKAEYSCDYVGGAKLVFKKKFKIPRKRRLQKSEY